MDYTLTVENNNFDISIENSPDFVIDIDKIGPAGADGAVSPEMKELEASAKQSADVASAASQTAVTAIETTTGIRTDVQALKTQIDNTAEQVSVDAANAHQAALDAQQAAQDAQQGSLSQVQSNWNTTDVSDPSYIQNKPILAAVATSGLKSDVGLGAVDNTSDIDKPISTLQQAALDEKANITYVDAKVAALVDSAPETLNTLNEFSKALGDDPAFATSTANALGNRLRFDVNDQNLTAGQKANAVQNLGLAPIAASGIYSDLTGIPSIPNKTSDIANDSGFIDQTGARNAISVTGSLSYNPISGIISYNAPLLSLVAISGSYNDLTNKPIIPTATSNLANDSGFVNQADVRNAISATGSISYDASTGIFSYIAPTLATVAISGSYNDLSNKPTIPPQYTDAQAKSAISVTGSLSYDPSTGIIGYTAPALAAVATSGAYSDLSGRPTFSAVATSGSYNDLSGKPAIPTNNSQLTNDSGYITSSIIVDVTHNDKQLSNAIFVDCAVKAIDKGNSGTSPVVFDYPAGSKQKITATGAHAFSFSNWPPAGNEGYMRVDFKDYGNFVITPPTVIWTNPDGTETTSLSAHFTALAAAGGRSGFTTNGITKAIFWSSDAGVTVYGKFI